jgi:hypothetical protein
MSQKTDKTRGKTKGDKKTKSKKEKGQ